MADVMQTPTAAGGKPAGGRIKDYIMGIAVVVVVIMIVVPLPAPILDALMAMNLTFSLLVLLIVVYSQKPTEFSLFPTVLLVATVFSLALNISSARLILEQGGDFQGRMILAFSDFVVGGGGGTQGIVIGFLLLIIFIAVQLVVITKGATRISEVAARFALDSMPVKMMAIDTEFSSGSISEDEAQRRKLQVQKESDFYASMDGASKFISGYVKVGIFIIVLEMIGGMIIVVILQGMTVAEAIPVFIRLAIGDGLVTQLPTFLISTAMGIVVTRAASTGNLTEQASKQFTTSARSYWIGAGVLLFLAILPGFPTFVLIALAAVMSLAAFQIGRKRKAQESFSQMMAQSGETRKAKPENGEMSPIVPLDTLSMELGYGLIPLVDKEKGADLLERVQGVRRQSALELGLVIPKVHIMDNISLDPSEYCFKIKGVDIGRGRIRLGYFLCIVPGMVSEEVPGEPTVDPAFGLPAIWVTEDRRDDAERAGYTVVDPPSIVATHLTEIIRRHAADILGMQETQAILDTLRKDYPAVVDEVMRPELGMPVVKIQKILHGLLRERVSIRNMVTILETIAEYAPLSKNVWFLVEKARQALGSQICRQYADENRALRVLTIAPELEQKIMESRHETPSGVICALDPATQKRWITAVGRAALALKNKSILPVILCTEQARFLVRQSTERELPELAVLSVQEIAPDVVVESVGVIRLDGGGGE